MTNPITYPVAMEVASHEALVRQAYKNPGDVWTWSIGLTSATGHMVERYIGKPQSLTHCLRVFVWALDNYADVVRRVFGELPEHVFAGALSFTWNMGEGALKTASWVKYYKAGDMKNAERSFKLWNKARNARNELIVNDGLVKRRKQEADLIFRGIWSHGSTIVEYTRVTPAVDYSSGKRVDISKALKTAIDGEIPAPDKVIVEKPVASPALKKPWWKSKEFVAPLAAGGGASVLKELSGFPWENLIILAVIGLAGYLMWSRNRERKTVESEEG